MKNIFMKIVYKGFDEENRGHEAFLIKTDMKRL